MAGDEGGRAVSFVAHFGIALGFGIGIFLVFQGLTADRPASVFPWLRRIAPRTASSLGGAVVAFLATGWPAAAIAGALVGHLAPRAIDARKSERLRNAQREALAEAAARMRDAVRAGLGLFEGLALVAGSSPQALTREIRELASESRAVGLPRAAESFASKIEDPLASLFARALALAESLGSSGVVEVLDGLAESAQSMAFTMREVRARQVRQKMSARVVAGVPILLLLAIRLTNPEYLAPYSTASGQLLLIIGLAMIGLGYWAMLATARLPEPKAVTKT